MYTHVPPIHFGFAEYWQSAMTLQHNQWFMTIVIVIFVDMITGFSKGFFKNSKKKLDSTTGFQKAIKHIIVIMVVLFLYPLLDVWGLQFIGNGFIIFFIGEYGISITENFGAMGIPFPKFVTEKLEKLKESGEDINK